MKVVVATHPSALEHDTGPGHPENPQRVAAVLRGVGGSGLEVVELEAPRAAIADLERVHDASYIEHIRLLCDAGGGMLDYDTVVSPASYEAALRAAGGVMALIEDLETRSDATGFAVSRPPGHHALSARAMGFCLFNNVAVAAAALREREMRVAILDWDVHHGNGTQALLGDDPGVLYVSLHQDGFYPYEGVPGDIDRMAPGTNVNVPLQAGTAGDVVRELWDGVVVPVVGLFEPDWVLVSAGFDAHQADPLAELSLVGSDYGYMAEAMRRVIAPERVVVALEGGYDPGALEESVSATLMGLAGEAPPGDPLSSPPGSRLAADTAVEAVSRHWAI
jgi:acetoin utilization deacetylase AcuC-like enzyme